jgi:5-formyltetrahydrofolate cyclo-ligase
VDDPTELRQAKADLRARMRAIRDAIAIEERSAMSALIVDHALALPQVAGALTVMTYASMGSEVQTTTLIARLAAAGTRVALPVVGSADMRAVHWRPGDPVQRSRYGANEPASGASVDPTEVDVVLAPGLAFDRDGNRLGYGGGYFDRFMAAMRPDALRAGLAFGQQVIDGVPHDEHDQPVNQVITDSGGRPDAPTADRVAG